MGEDFCKEAPSGLMKVCKALQAKCMALKAVAEQKTCMHAATKELQEKMKTLDFCAQAPSHIAQKCQYEQKEVHDHFLRQREAEGLLGGQNEGAHGRGESWIWVWVWVVYGRLRYRPQRDA